MKKTKVKVLTWQWRDLFVPGLFGGRGQKRIFSNLYWSGHSRWFRDAILLTTSVTIETYSSRSTHLGFIHF